ncbi:MAG: SDR family oxidoreductase [Gemmatimonadaceae bacterium]|nr:SDR family oxidoreductase [Gemmatimonadaceae bacterium]
MDLGGRVALVTGAGRRVGRAIALALAAKGMRLAVHYHHAAADAEESVRLALAAGAPDAWTISADLRDVDACARLIDDVAQRGGALDVLVNSAAEMHRTPFDSITLAEWDDIMALNLRSPFFCSQAAARHMRDGGAIVNIADLAALETWPEYIPHGISKAGVMQLTRALARTLAPAIRVNAVVPGAVLLPEHWTKEDADRLIRTTPLARLGAPEDVAHAVVYLLESDYVTGDAVVVDGGRHLR